MTDDSSPYLAAPVLSAERRALVLCRERDALTDRIRRNLANGDLAGQLLAASLARRLNKLNTDISELRRQYLVPDAGEPGK